MCSHRHSFFGIYAYIGKRWTRRHAFTHSSTTRMEREHDGEGDQSGSSARKQGQSCVCPSPTGWCLRKKERICFDPHLLSVPFSPFSYLSMASKNIEKQSARRNTEGSRLTLRTWAVISRAVSGWRSRSATLTNTLLPKIVPGPQRRRRPRAD